MLDWQSLMGPVVIALVPIIVALLKKLIPESMSWLFPVLATVLGAALDTLSQYTTGISRGPAAGAALGLAGVGLREVIDQLRKPRLGP